MSSVEQRALDDATDVANVLSSREFRDHAAPFAMNPRLRRDDARQLAPRLRRVAGLLHQSGCRLVAGCLDAEDDHFGSGLWTLGLGCLRPTAYCRRLNSRKRDSSTAQPPNPPPGITASPSWVG